MLSLIVPVHNEAGSMPTLLERLDELVQTQPWEIIIVDDGSTDRGTDSVLCTDRIRVIRLPQRKGKCFALYTGLQLATQDVVAILDGDLQHEPRQVLELLDHLDSTTGMVIAHRLDRHDPLLKRLYSKAGNRVCNWVFHTALKDHNAALKVFRKGIVFRVPYYRNFHRFLGVIAIKRGYGVREIALAHCRRRWGHSKYGYFDRLVGNVMAAFKTGQILSTL